MKFCLMRSNYTDNERSSSPMLKFTFASISHKRIKKKYFANRFSWYSVYQEVSRDLFMKSDAMRKMEKWKLFFKTSRFSSSEKKRKTRRMKRNFSFYWFWHHIIIIIIIVNSSTKRKFLCCRRKMMKFFISWRKLNV